MMYDRNSFEFCNKIKYLCSIYVRCIYKMLGWMQYFMYVSSSLMSADILFLQFTITIFFARF